MRVLSITLLICLFFISMPIYSQDTAPIFEETECPFDIPNGQTVDCGYLTVPENRNNPDSAMIRLAVGIFRTSSDTPASDPVVYLVGGPGGHALATMPFNFNAVFTPFIEDRDFVVIDQRGTGFSEPALGCPEIADLVLSEFLSAEIEPEESLQLYNQALQVCHDRLESEGVDFTGYNSAQNAADLNELRLALGYEEWNVYGSSYGTRLAQTYMRDFPEGIRCVILDAAYPIEANLITETPANAHRAFNTLFEGCAADANCNDAYPDLETVFFDAVDQLNENPQMTEITEPLSGNTYDLQVNGVFFEGFLFSMLYRSTVIPLLPQIIFEVSDGDLTTLSLLYGSQLANFHFFSIGMQYAVECNEEVHFTDRDDVIAAAEEYPELEDLFKNAGMLGENIFGICEFFGAGTADPIENEPIVSDIPTLIIAGEYDPITPPSWGAGVHENLSNSYFYEIPGAGHGAGAGSFECPLNIVLAFLDDPFTEPDASCIDTLGSPEFVVPAEIEEEIILEPFSRDDIGLSSLAPAEWTQVEASIHARISTALDQTVLIQDVLNLTVDEYLDRLVQQFGFDGEVEITRTEALGNYEWDFYEMEVRGFSVDVAITSQDHQIYFALLISDPEERDILVDLVLIPVLEDYEVN